MWACSNPPEVVLGRRADPVPDRFGALCGPESARARRSGPVTIAAWIVVVGGLLVGFSVLWDWYRATLSPANMALDERGGPPAQAGGGLRRTGRTAGEHDPRARSRDPLIGAVAFSIDAPPWVNLVVPLLESGATE